VAGQNPKPTGKWSGRYGEKPPPDRPQCGPGPAVWRQKHKPIDTDPSLPVFMNCLFQNRIGNARKEANQPNEQEPPGRMEIRQAALFCLKGLYVHILPYFHGAVASGGNCENIRYCSSSCHRLFLVFQETAAPPNCSFNRPFFRTHPSRK
jgi:hypothetical protein